MDYVNLGSSGLKVSKLCLGMMAFGDPAVLDWSLEEEAAEPIVKAAVEAGICFFDTAEYYSNGESERLTGRLLAKFLPAKSASSRQRSSCR